MERIAIVTDSSCEMSDAELANIDVRCVHLRVIMPDNSCFPEDNTSENIEAYYDYIADCEELPSTSMPSPFDFGELYTQLSLEGYTHIIVLPMSSAMSGTYNSACMAAQSAPVPVEVIDTHCNTAGQYLLVLRIARLRDDGATFRQLVDAANELAGKTSVCFMLDTLRNIVKGGRTGKAVGLLVNVLKIKPLLTVDATGEVDIFGKAKSMKRAAKKLADHFQFLETRFGPLEYCFVHTRNLQGIKLLREEFESRGIQQEHIDVCQAGPVIATHVSVGCFGFGYIPRLTS